MTNDIASRASVTTAERSVRGSEAFQNARREFIRADSKLAELNTELGEMNDIIQGDASGEIRPKVMSEKPALLVKIQAQESRVAASEQSMCRLAPREQV